MKDSRFNILSTQQKYTSTKTTQILDDQEQPERTTSVAFTRMKRKYNDLDTQASIRSEIRPALQTLSIQNNTNLFTKSKDFKQIFPSKEEKEKAIFSKPKLESKIKSLDTLEKYFYIDERYIETDKNIGNLHNPSIFMFN
jgi:hypothetical protein